ncbi:hypothetical protein [Absidia glauca]|uniref:Far11/STRP C-terminal domain-containing protein n=1 Tax=Absidia glauca TaxID=4829 RepID=A0A163KVS4_ABSGL|nr:hypothetical protein [Absidia glauca]
MSTITTVVLQDDYVQPNQATRPGSAQLKHKASPKSQKHHHGDYEYKDSENLKTEINELFSYEETKQLLESHHKGHPDHIHGTDRTVEPLIHAVRLVTECGGFDLVCRRLKKIMKKISAFENQATLDMVEELELYLTLTYLMVETQRQNSDTSGMLDVSFVSFLFCFLGKITDQNAKVLPIRKLLLLVWKCMLVIFGGSTELQQTREAQSSSSSSSASTASTAAMGLTRASKQTDLPYQDCCRHTTTASRSSGTLKLRGKPCGSMVPSSVIEAGQLYLDHLHPSIAHRQLIEQRDRVIRKLGPPPSHFSDSIALDCFERFYKSMVPDLQSVMVFLLKQLLNSLTPSTEVDKSRNNQIHCKAISAILVLFLKWAKLSHVLKFEYASQVLVDSGAILLLLKLFGLQDLEALAGCPSEFENSSLYHTSNKPTNQRNMFWMINLLRVLQKLTKSKSNRVMVMVQYKSSTMFKKLLKISHPVLELYALKILKSQVPYQTRKWRANNMKIISAIYLRCQTSLYDDWMGKADVDDELMDGKAEEINIRLLARIYHSECYDLAELLPFYDHQEEALEDEEGELELDPSFVANYEIWLDDDNDVANSEEPTTQTFTKTEETTLQKAVQDLNEDEDYLSIAASLDAAAFEDDDETIQAFDEDDEDDDDESVSTPEDDELSVQIRDLALNQDDDKLGTPIPTDSSPDYFYYSKSGGDRNDWVDPTTMDCRTVQLHHHQQQQQQRHGWSHSI